ncbi:MAG: hypothetical protein ACYCZJ_16155, partial [Sulfuriferula sp.]
IQQLQQKAIPVQQACRVLSVSRAGYYQSLRRPVNAARLQATIHLKAAFAASAADRGFYSGRGSPLGIADGDVL